MELGLGGESKAGLHGLSPVVWGPPSPSEGTSETGSEPGPDSHGVTWLTQHPWSV